MPLIAADTEIRYTGNGVGAVFVLPCEIEVATDFLATIDDVVTTAYTLSGVGNDTGVTCTFDLPPPNGSEIVLARVAPYDRQRYDYQLGDFNPDTIDADIDRMGMLVQQLATTLKRVPRAKRGRLDLSLELTPSPGDLLAWAGDGLSIVNVDPSTISLSALVFTAIGQALATAANAAGARSAIGAMSQSDVNTSIGASFSWRNVLVNGDMQIDQRNEGVAVNLGTAAGTLCVDRWFVRSLSAPSGTLQVQRAGAGVNGQPQYVLQFSRSAGTYAGNVVAEQIAPFEDTYHWGGKTVTVSCLVRKGTAFSGTGVKLSLIAGGGSSGHAALVAGTWAGQAVVATASAPSASLPSGAAAFLKLSATVTLGTTNVREFAVRLEVEGFSGSGAAADYIQFADVQLEQGGIATEFEKVPYPLQKLRCERFYEKSYVEGVRPGTASTDGAQQHRAAGTGGVLETIHWRFHAPKYQLPTVTWYSTVTGAAGFCRDTTGAADVAITGAVLSSGLVSTGNPTIAAAVAGRLYEVQFTCDAEYRT